MDDEKYKDRIKNYQDFSRFLDDLRDDLEKNEDEWQNLTLSAFLEAMSAFIVDMESFDRKYFNNELPKRDYISSKERIDWDNLNWNSLVQIFIGTKYQE